jgi:N-acetylneuraminic acid mutarotase
MRKNLITILIIFQSVAQVFGQNYVWTQKADFGGGTRYAAFGFSIGNTGFAGSGVGFLSGNYQYVYTDFWKYDQPNDTWVQLANHPAPCRNAASGFSIADKGYVTVGWSSSNQLATSMKYDTASNTWSSVANFGGSARYTASQFVIGNFAYVGTGYTPYSSDFWKYDPVANSWTQVANMGGIARQGATGFTIGNYGYVFGGGQQNLTYTNELWRYDPTANSWSQMTSCPCSGRDGSFSFAFNGKGFIGGGADNATTFQDFYEYDTASNAWTQRADYGGGPIVAPFYFTIGNRGYVGSGSSNFYPNIIPSNEVWEWGPIENPKGIDKQNYSGSIDVYAFDNSLRISFSKECKEDVFLTLFDISGKLFGIYTMRAGNKSAEFSLGDISKGTVLYKLETESSKIKSGKIILL